MRRITIFPLLQTQVWAALFEGELAAEFRKKQGIGDDVPAVTALPWTLYTPGYQVARYVRVANPSAEVLVFNARPPGAQGTEDELEQRRRTSR